MSDPIQLGERLRIEVPNATNTSGDKHTAMAWTARKDQKSGTSLNILNIGTKHHHFAKLSPTTCSDLCDLIAFQSPDGLNSSSSDDVVRYGVAYSLRCLTRSKSGGRYLSPNNESLAWDRHAEALRTDHTARTLKAQADDDFKDPEPHNEMFRVVHLVATNMRRDWQEDIQAAGNALVPSSRFGLVHEQRLEAGKPAYVAASTNGQQLHFVPDLGPLCVFVIRRVQLDQVLRAGGLLSTLPKTIESEADAGFVPSSSFVGEVKKEETDEDDQSHIRSNSTLHKALTDYPSEFIECQYYSYGQWIARKGDFRFCTVDNKALKLNKNLVPWWTADGLSHWRVALDAEDNDGDGEISTDHEGWMYGTGWSRMFKNDNPQLTNVPNHKYRLRKFEKFEPHQLLEWNERCGSCAGELLSPITILFYILKYACVTIGKY